MNPSQRSGLFLLALFSALLTGRAAPAGAEALLLVTGDQHSAYERTAQLVATVDRLKAENPGLPLAILLDGDTLEYSNIVARRSGGAVDFAMFTALAARAPTILNLGNHEPEFYDLEETVRRVEATGVKVVSNITNRATNRPFAPASVLLPLGRETAVVVGVTTDNLSFYRVAVRPSLDLANPVVWAKKNFPLLLKVERADPSALNDIHPGEKRPEVRPLHPTINIVLSHTGIAADKQLLALVPDGTLFAGAHDHVRFVQPSGRTVYFHSGSWGEYLSLAWLCRDAAGAPRWVVEQIHLATDGPAEAALAALIRETKAKYLTPEDTAVVGRVAVAMSTAEAAKFAAGALADAAKVDAAFIGNTTFGAGLPAGGVTRTEFDSCVRFDGTLCTAEVGGARLQQLLAAANQGPDTPFEQRHGEFCFAAGPGVIDPAKTYRIATTDWGAKNSVRYFGEPVIVWSEQPALKLKAAVLAKLAGTNAAPAGR
ncbi:MAG: 5'-nucleotidase C-terminal domain-containing protein, partial [bacterium]|nr:5'-nucleotidase C-terminal domain-containing protein [bacterium]MDI1337156.1 5'-nucleotidase C-terminal domain-containing protein [Lacunisphaera sp.]